MLGNDATEDVAADDYGDDEDDDDDGDDDDDKNDYHDDGNDDEDEEDDDEDDNNCLGATASYPRDDVGGAFSISSSAKGTIAGSPWKDSGLGDGGATIN